MKRPKLIFISHEQMWYGLDFFPVPEENREQLARMIAEHDFSVCYNRAAHAPDVRYIGNGRFLCGACERLDKVTAC